MKMSKLTMAITPVMGIIHIDYSKQHDTQFQASMLATKHCKEHGDKGLLVVKLDGKLTVVHESEAKRKDDVTLYKASKNGLWIDNPEDPRVIKFSLRRED